MLPGGTRVLGSVATLQGTNPWEVALVSSSVLSVPVGSTIVMLQAPSIVGTYTEDAAHASTSKGLFVMGVRNDTMASVTSADSDYSPFGVDSAGRTLVKPFSSEDNTIISYTGSVVSASVTLVAASALGKRNYITDFWIVNTGAAAQLITFRDGSTSVLGYTIAPATGGSNSPGIAIPIKTAPAQDLAFQATGTSSVVYVTVKGFQAP